MGIVPQINRGGFALTRGVCSADLNVESVAEVAVNATLKVNRTDSVVGAEALAKGYDRVTYKIYGPKTLTTGFSHGIIGITRAHRFFSFL